MEIVLRVGSKVVNINTGWNDGEQDSTWGEIMDELIFPALRGHGYIIDESWSSEITDYHRDYLAEKAMNK